MSKKEKNDLFRYLDLIIIGGGTFLIGYGLLNIFEESMSKLGIIYFPELGIWAETVTWFPVIGSIIVVMMLYLVYRRSIK